MSKMAYIRVGLIVTSYPMTDKAWAQLQRVFDYRSNVRRRKRSAELARRKGKS